MSEGLFEEPTRVPLSPGDKALLLTMWGEEVCTVVRVFTKDTFPMVTVDTTSGDTITVNRSSLQEMPANACEDG